MDGSTISVKIWFIWQQHTRSLCRTKLPSAPRETLDKWKDVVFETAEFMASYTQK